MTTTHTLSNQHQANLTLEIKNTKVKYQWVFNLNSTNICEYNAFTFPNLQQRWKTFKQRGNLLGIAAFEQNNMVGLVVAECCTNTNTAEITAFFSLLRYI